MIRVPLYANSDVTQIDVSVIFYHHGHTVLSPTFFINETIFYESVIVNITTACPENRPGSNWIFSEPVIS